MNTRKIMIIGNNKIITPDVRFYKYNNSTYKWDITFNSGKTFSYNYDNVSIFENPEILNPTLYKIEHLGKELFNVEAIYVFKDSYRAFWHVCFSNGSE